MAQVWSDLLAHTGKADGGSAAQNVGGYLAIADPKNGWNFADTGCGPSSVAPNAPYGLAGMEALYVAAVGYYHAHPHTCPRCDRIRSGMRGDRPDDRQRVQPGQLQHDEPVLGRAERERQLLRPTLPIIFGDNVTYTQDSVVAGASQIALLPKSFVVAPGGNDTNFWAEVPACGVASITVATVSNGWTTHITHVETCIDTDYVAGNARQRRGQDQLPKLWEAAARRKPEDPGRTARVLPADQAVGGRRKRRSGSELRPSP